MGNALIGIVKMVIRTVFRPVKTAVYGQGTAFKNGKCSLIKVRVRPVIITRFKSDIGGVFIPVASGYNQSDTVKNFSERQCLVCMFINKARIGERPPGPGGWDDF